MRFLVLNGTKARGEEKFEQKMNRRGDLKYICVKLRLESWRMCRTETRRMMVPRLHGGRRY